MSEFARERGWEVVIGLEVHAQLATGAKLFAPEAYVFGAEPNAGVSIVSSAQPGSLPMLDAAAIDLALAVALALECDIAPTCRFDRKHYFYCDLPKGYQITQFFAPYCTGGAVELADGRRVPLVRIHVEEDAGKAVHDRGTDTLVDLDRAGVPLIELVTAPALASAADAVAFLEAYKAVLEYTRASDADMEKGNLRCDVNVSVRRPGEALRTKVELKNLNSLRNVAAAVEFEVVRQVSAYEAGRAHEVVQETRAFDADKGTTRTLRSKEDAHDYRYMPDPDLPVVYVSSERLARVRSALPQLPNARRRRYRDELSLSSYDTEVLVGNFDLSSCFDAVLSDERARPHAKTVANLLSNQVLGALARSPGLRARLREKGFSTDVAELVHMMGTGALGTPAGRQVLAKVLEEGGSPLAWAERLDLLAVQDDAALDGWCRAALAANEKAAAAVRAGNEKAVGALVGAVMKASGGKADPAAVREHLAKLLQ